MLGGGWRKPGVLAAAALHALQDVRERMTQDHINAQNIAKGGLYEEYRDQSEQNAYESYKMHISRDGIDVMMPSRLLFS